MIPISIIVLFFHSHIKFFILDLAASKPRCVIIGTVKKKKKMWQFLVSCRTTRTRLLSRKTVGATLVTGVLHSSLMGLLQWLLYLWSKEPGTSPQMLFLAQELLSSLPSSLPPRPSLLFICNSL